MALLGVTLFEKKKSRICELELEMIMHHALLRKMQEGGGFTLHPLPMFHDPDYRPKPITVNCPNKSTFTINECPTCTQWFHSNDILLLVVVTHTMYLVWHSMGLLTHVARLLIARKYFIITG
jgi:hypothetical protein